MQDQDLTIKHFEIGCVFYTATGPWVVVDVGTKFVLAVKQQQLSHWNGDSSQIVIFDHYDFGGCSFQPLDE